MSRPQPHGASICHRLSVFDGSGHGPSRIKGTVISKTDVIKRLFRNFGIKTYSAILLSLLKKKEGSPSTDNNIDEPGRCYAK